MKKIKTVTRKVYGYNPKISKKNQNPFYRIDNKKVFVKNKDAIYGSDFDKNNQFIQVNTSNIKSRNF